MQKLNSFKAQFLEFIRAGLLMILMVRLIGTMAGSGSGSGEERLAKLSPVKCVPV